MHFLLKKYENCWSKLIPSCLKYMLFAWELLPINGLTTSCIWYFSTVFRSTEKYLLLPVVIPTLIKAISDNFLRRNNLYPKFVLNQCEAVSTDTMHRIKFHDQKYLLISSYLLCPMHLQYFGYFLQLNQFAPTVLVFLPICSKLFRKCFESRRKD